MLKQITIEIGNFLQGKNIHLTAEQLVLLEQTGFQLNKIINFLQDECSTAPQGAVEIATEIIGLVADYTKKQQQQTVVVRTTGKKGSFSKLIPSLVVPLGFVVLFTFGVIAYSRLADRADGVESKMNIVKDDVAKLNKANDDTQGAMTALGTKVNLVDKNWRAQLDEDNKKLQAALDNKVETKAFDAEVKTRQELAQKVDDADKKSNDRLSVLGSQLATIRHDFDKDVAFRAKNGSLQKLVDSDSGRDSGSTAIGNGASGHSRSPYLWDIGVSSAVKKK